MTSIGRGCHEKPIEKLYSPNLHGVQSENFLSEKANHNHGLNLAKKIDWTLQIELYID